MWYFVVRHFIGRESPGHRDKVQLSCPVGGTPTEEPFCVVLASSLRGKSKVLLWLEWQNVKTNIKKKDLHEN